MKDVYQTIILGGGISGLTIAHKLRLHKTEHSFLVLEKNDSTGGTITSHNEQGYITEGGPHGFLDNNEESRQILLETGLDKECIKAPLIDFVRYVYLDGKLNRIPQTPKKILMAPLIPWHAKLRILADLWKPPLINEPTVAKWIKYRFGPALLPYLDAVYTGTYAGDIDELAIDGVMPGIRALEKEHGSVLLGMIKKMKKKRRRQGIKDTFTMPAMTSFPSGMRRLIKRLTEDLTLGQNLLLNTVVGSVHAGKEGWNIISSKGQFRAKNIVFALPINATLQILAQTCPDIPAKSIPEAHIASVSFGFTDDVNILPGFGFLSPEQEQRFVMGSLFTSNMFSHRAPAGHILMETFVGGRRHPERLELDDQTLAQRTLADIQDILNITKEPIYTKVVRPTEGIPQLEQNYLRLHTWRKSFIATHPGLHICGFGWDGIGINDTIKYASRVAAKVLTPSIDSQQNSDIKAVYF